MKAAKRFVIRCETPDCDWGHSMPTDLSDWEIHVKKCYAAFRQHCIERHGLGDHEKAWVCLNIEYWTISLSSKEELDPGHGSQLPHPRHIRNKRRPHP
jgi:hypothetical protein